MTPDDLGYLLEALIPLLVVLAVAGPLAALFAYDGIGAAIEFLLTLGKPGAVRQSSKNPVICPDCGAFVESTEPCNPSSKS